MPNADEPTIFNAALQMKPHSRRAYLEDACGDDGELLTRISAQLAEHDRSQELLDTPAHESRNTHEELETEKPGTLIGPYKLLERIGEGGMGSVYRAEQSSPVQREVALKIIKPGMDSRTIIARFETERQALAVMDYPNIAKVLDAGATPSGRPYFVMELVKGTSITKYCDEHQLTPPRRLELMIAACQAVQHAHQKGIIHRDLKPSNILVTHYDGKPTPRIIDFGIAKVTSAGLSDYTLTEFGSVIGTLEYMSPEQAEPIQNDIDTRTDIYSLGVVLYELLTGSTPFDRKRFQDAGWAEMLRFVRETDPPKPSDRLSTVAELPSIAANRGIEPRRLSGLIRGDLDWIVMKSLEKDRTRRYATASGFAQDIQRYLDEQPVEAGPPSTGYRMRKFARRHRTLLAAASVSVLLLMVGLAISVWQAYRATNAERQARASEWTALEEKKRADVQAATVLNEKQRADDEAATALAVIEFLQKDLLGQADTANQPGDMPRNKDLTVHEVLDRASAAIGSKFQGKEQIEGAIRLTVGKAYLGMGDYAKAKMHAKRSLELLRQKLGDNHPSTLESLTFRAMVHRKQGELDEAGKIFERVLELRRAVHGPRHSETRIAMQNLGSNHMEQGRFDEAEALLKEVLAIDREMIGDENLETCLAMNNLATLYLFRGRRADAEPLLKQAIKGFTSNLGVDHPFTLTCTGNLAGCYMELRRFDEAEPLFQRVLDLNRKKHGPDHPDTVDSMNFVALVHDSRKRYREAEPLLRQVLAARLAKLGPNHPDTLTSKSNLGLTLQSLKRFDEAEPLLRESLEGRRIKLPAKHPDILRSTRNLALLFRDTGRPREAEPLLLEAASGAFEKLGPKHPQTQLYINNLADLYDKLAKPAEAAAWRMKLAVEKK